MSTEIKRWNEQQDDDLWIFGKVQKSDIQYAEAEIQALRSALRTAHSQLDELSNRNKELVKKSSDLTGSLNDLVNVINSAGLLNLSNGVQLGPTVWYVKASNALENAEQVLTIEES